MRHTSEELQTPSRLWLRLVAVATLHALLAAFATACGGPTISQVPGPPVNIRLDPPGGELTSPVVVSVQARGAPRLDCTAPCGMTAPAGTHLVHVTGGQRPFFAIVTIPSYAAIGRVRYANAGLRTAGLIFDGIGSVLIATGSAITAAGLSGLILVGLAGTGLVFLIPGIIMGAAAGSDTIDFTPWGGDRMARAAERRRLAAGALLSGVASSSGTPAGALPLTPLVTF